METNIIYNENCLYTLNERILDNSVDLTVTSPPYDDLRTYNNEVIWNKDVWKKIISGLFRITKQGGVVVWIVGDSTVNGSETGTSFEQALYAKECGFNLHDTMIYRKNSLPYPSSNRYYQCFEYMFVWSKGVPKTVNLIADRRNRQANKKITGTSRKKDGNLVPITTKERNIKDVGVRFNIWTYNTGWGHSYTEKYLRNCPAIFPERLAEDLIISWSNKNDIIYDPFLGSGTTVVASMKLDRRYIGTEVVEEYFNISKRRINETKSDLRRLFNEG